jgi:hypothetical protein
MVKKIYTPLFTTSSMTVASLCFLGNSVGCAFSSPPYTWPFLPLVNLHLCCFCSVRLILDLTGKIWIVQAKCTKELWRLAQEPQENSLTSLVRICHRHLPLKKSSMMQRTSIDFTGQARAALLMVTVDDWESRKNNDVTSGTQNCWSLISSSRLGLRDQVHSPHPDRGHPYFEGVVDPCCRHQ